MDWPQAVTQVQDPSDLESVMSAKLAVLSWWQVVQRLPQFLTEWFSTPGVRRRDRVRTEANGCASGASQPDPYRYGQPMRSRSGVQA